MTKLKSVLKLISIYKWAMKPWVKKNGAIKFKTGTAGVIFDLQFINAYCISLNRTITTQGEGLTTALVISPETVSMNGVSFDNNWVK